MNTHRVGELVADDHTGVEGGRRVLEDDRDDPTDAPARLRGPLRHLLALEEDLAGGRGDETAHDVRGRRLAAAGLADDPERLAFLDAHGHAAHGLDLVRAEQGARS
ncbi:Uncharacterised protein [Chlamydia trachomatis]|nr:Uncharacterised protein [Chlamydia trachomatis]